jgi:hypothetical protein
LVLHSLPVFPFKSSVPVKFSMATFSVVSCSILHGCPKFWRPPAPPWSPCGDTNVIGIIFVPQEYPSPPPPPHHTFIPKCRWLEQEGGGSGGAKSGLWQRGEDEGDGRKIRFQRKCLFFFATSAFISRKTIRILRDN